MEKDLPKTIGAFLVEAVGYLGQRELLIAGGAAFVIVWIAMWVVAKLIDRQEKHLGAAFSSSLMLVLMAGFLGVAYLALLLKGLLANGTPPSPASFLACAAVTALLVLITVSGAFGTAWWKTLVLLTVLAGTAAGSTYVGHQFILAGRAAQLPALAAQVAGIGSEDPSLLKSEELKKVGARNRLRVEQKELKQRQNGLMKIYLSLQEERAKLNVADSAAVTLFNQHAAEYQKEKQYLQTRLAELDAL
jgi:hypothetical protein